MPDKPLLFLDVDGVLNCPGPREHEHVPHFIGHETIWVPRGTDDRVAKLLGFYEPFWATAWMGRAHAVWRDVLGLPEVPWRWLDYREYKLVEIIRVAKDRRWAWIDDDADWELRNLGWDRSMVTGRIVATDYREGLTDAHVGELIAYARMR